MIDSRLLLTRAFFASTNDDDNTNTDKTTSTTRSFSSLLPDSNLGRLSKGVVFYLTPKEKRLVGILLWNMPDEIYSDKDYPGPSRLNLARSLLAERHIIGGGKDSSLKEKDLEGEEKEKNDLRELASRFDIYGEISEEYAQLQEFIKAKGLDMAKLNESDNNNESVNNKDGDISQP
ncbi:unnamed protein product [Trichobilharzia regenti]|nr:unnamed protein product [Trichobilharzia regenti]